jgi:predicted HTH domain antitoxin
MIQRHGDLETTMKITLQIPDSVARSLRIPEAEAEELLHQELAAALYANGLLSFGKTSELAGLSRVAFSGILGQRHIARHYAEDEMNEDTRYPAVSNTSPIFNLACINRLPLLPEQFGDVWIPKAVDDELRKIPDNLTRQTVERAR